jgi:hypothetical protein
MWQPTLTAPHCFCQSDGQVWDRRFVAPSVKALPRRHLGPAHLFGRARCFEPSPGLLSCAQLAGVIGGPAPACISHCLDQACRSKVYKLHVNLEVFAR